MGQRGTKPEQWFPESEWLDRNAAMLRRVPADRRASYLTGVRIVRGEAAERALVRLTKEKR